MADNKFLIIGQENCNRCEMVKRLFEEKGIDYKYSLISEYPKEEQNKYMRESLNAKLTSFPLVFKDEKIVDFREVL